MRIVDPDNYWFSPRDDRDVVAPPSETRPLIEQLELDLEWGSGSDD